MSSFMPWRHSIAGMRSGDAPGSPFPFFLLRIAFYTGNKGWKGFIPSVSGPNWSGRRTGTVEQDASLFVVVRTQRLVEVVEFGSSRVTKVLPPALGGSSYSP